MFLAVFTILFVGASGRELSEPKFRVLTPDELMVEVPHYEDMELVTFRIGVRRKDNELEDLELGENVMNNNRIFIYDERLDLKRDDVVNYLLVFKDKEGYQAQTGKYVFDGVYFKKPFGRRHRFRRTVISTTEKPENNSDETEEFNPVESRFGHHHRGRGGGGWPGNNEPFNPFIPPGHNPHGFPGRGPPNFYPGEGPQFPNYPYPPSGGDCNDHRHDMCHNPDVERSQKTTSKPSFDKDYHCRMCHQNEPQTQRPIRRTTTEYPDIDIRFSDD